MNITDLLEKLVPSTTHRRKVQEFAEKMAAQQQDEAKLEQERQQDEKKYNSLLQSLSEQIIGQFNTDNPTDDTSIKKINIEFMKSKDLEELISVLNNSGYTCEVVDRVILVICSVDK